MGRIALHWQIIIAIVLAALAGSVTTVDQKFWGVGPYDIYLFMGTLFLNALKMIIVPLVMASIINGMAGISRGDELGRLGGKTLLFYACSSLLAILVGLALVNLSTPGIVNGEAAGKELALSASSEELDAVIEKVSGRSAGDVAEIFIRMVPVNIVEAAADGAMLGLIFFSLLFGFFMMRISEGPSRVLQQFWQGVFETMMKITLWIMQFAPLGVFGLVAKTVTQTGFAAFQPLLVFFVTVVGALAVHMFVTLPILLKLSGVSPMAHLKAMSPAMLTAFSTASSSATLPLTVECVEKGSGVSNRTTSFVLPLGATINMDGTALYECVAAMFIAQAYGIDLSLTQQFTIVLVALITSIGVAGIPAASLVAISVILGVIGLPLEGLGLLLVTDRVLDMLRTSVNVYSDSCGAVVIARSEGEQTAIASR